MNTHVHRATTMLAGLPGRLRGLLFPDAQHSFIDPEARAFLPALDAIAEEPPPRSLQRTQWVLALFLVTGLIGSAIGQVDIVVRGSGRLATSAPPIVLQPLERSIVRELRVKPGDRVTAGQVLATLDPTFAQADVAQLSVRQRSLLAQMQRMEAELNGRPFDAGDGSDPERVLQADLYAQRHADYAARMNAYEADARRLEAQIHTAQAEADEVKRQLSVVDELVTMRETLLKSETGSRLNALDARNLRIRTEREYNGAINKQIETRHALASRLAEQRAFAETWRRETLEDLASARDEAAKVNEELVKASRLRTLVELVSPADAVVVDVAKRSLASVLREAEPLITLVPADSPLMAEIDLASADVGYAKAGDPVRVKVDAFPYQRHGMLEGTLANIAMQSVTPERNREQTDSPTPVSGTGGAIHRGEVTLTSNKLENMPEGTTLIPGMTITAEIKVGNRSVLSYFLYPVIRGFGESIREP